PVLERLEGQNGIARDCAGALRQLTAGLHDAAKPKKTGEREVITAVLRTIHTAGENCPHGKKKAWLAPLENLLDEAEFFLSLVEKTPRPGPVPFGRGEGESPAVPGREKHQGKGAEVQREAPHPGPVPFGRGEGESPAVPL